MGVPDRWIKLDPGVLIRSHPVRTAFVGLLADQEEPLSPRRACDLKEMKAALRLLGGSNNPLSMVSYHVRVLKSSGILELVRTEPRRGAVEHYYRLSERGRNAYAPVGDSVALDRIAVLLRSDLPIADAVIKITELVGGTGRDVI